MPDPPADRVPCRVPGHTGQFTHGNQDDAWRSARGSLDEVEDRVDRRAPGPVAHLLEGVDPRARAGFGREIAHLGRDEPLEPLEPLRLEVGQTDPLPVIGRRDHRRHPRAIGLAGNQVDECIVVERLERGPDLIRGRRIGHRGHSHREILRQQTVGGERDPGERAHHAAAQRARQLIDGGRRGRGTPFFRQLMLAAFRQARRGIPALRRGMNNQAASHLQRPSGEFGLVVLEEHGIRGVRVIGPVPRDEMRVGGTPL